MLTRLRMLLAVLGAVLLVAGFAFLLLLPRFDLGGLRSLRDRAEGTARRHA